MGGVETVVTSTASTILANVVTFISSIVAMIIISWQLTIVAVVTVPASKAGKSSGGVPTATS